nr:uncharacterized protein LOC113828828 [Penaeus vannamei]
MKIEDICESTMIKMNGITIRLWQNYDPSLLHSKGTRRYQCYACKKNCLNEAHLRKHEEKHPFCQYRRKRSRSQKEFHLCQVCQISVRTLGSLRFPLPESGHRGW